MKSENDINVTTNADRMRGMSDEELANWLIKIDCPPNVCPGQSCFDAVNGCTNNCWLDWLRQPAETEGTE